MMAIHGGKDQVDPRFSLAELMIGGRFLCKLPSFLRHPLTLQEIRPILRRRLEQREADFLGLMKRAVYEYAGSPYRDLLRLAGCEYGDLERLMVQGGVEGTLRTLFREGVYLTAEEFKGRRPIVRGNATIAVDPNSFQNSLSTSAVPAHTSGSRGAGTPVVLDFAFIRDRAVDSGLVLDALGGATWLHAYWGVPGAAGMAYVLEFCSLGVAPARWFSMVDSAAPGLHPRYRWSGRVMHWGSLLAGVAIPRPEYTPLDDPLRVARWMVEVLRGGQTPVLHTFASAGVRVCLAASEAGLDLRGARFTLSGEPTTAARLRVVRRVGAQALPRYASVECGPIGYGCLAAETADGLHLLHDLHALIQPGPDGATSDLPATALLLTSLRATAPLILLNVSLGDQAVVSQGACGCPLEALGWITHLDAIRSYEKLTAGGMTFLDRDLIRVLDEVLPARFGGGPTHYQLVEEETGEGHPRLRLLVHPAVGPVDCDALRESFLAEIGAGSGVERVMGLLWRTANFLRVERQAPYATPSGKILHLHVGQGSASLPVARPSA